MRNSLRHRCVRLRNLLRKENDKHRARTRSNKALSWAEEQHKADNGADGRKIGADHIQDIVCQQRAEAEYAEAHEENIRRA